MPRIERIGHPEDLPPALTRLGLDHPMPVLVMVGSAAGLSGERADAPAPLVDRTIVPICEQLGVAVIDGGTDSGVMQIVGRARAAHAATFPLIGVTAEGTIAGDRATISDAAPLEPNHSAVIAVPGEQWGDESIWLPRVAAAAARGRPIVGVLIGGGPVSVRDVQNLIDAGAHVLAIAGSGRLADALAAETDSGDLQIDLLRGSSLVAATSALDDGAGFGDQLRAGLLGR